MTQKVPAIWRRAPLCAALLTALTMAVPASAADLKLDFDDLDYTFLGAGDSFSYQGLQLTATSGLGDAAPGDLVGGIFDGNDPGMCMGLSCPVDNYSHGYYAGLNDGALAINGGAASGLHVKSFDASFIGAFPRDAYQNYYPAVAGLLEVRGYKADGSYVAERFELAGPYPVGTDFYMAHFDTSAGFASQAFTNVAFFAYSCNLAGECDAFKNNAGQFALDNLALSVSAVPEPATWMTLLAGLGALGVLRRRRSV